MVGRGQSIQRGADNTGRLCVTCINESLNSQYVLPLKKYVLPEICISRRRDEKKNAIRLLLFRGIVMQNLYILDACM